MNKQNSPEFILFHGEVIFENIANNLVASNFVQCINGWLYYPHIRKSCWICSASPKR